MQTTQRKQTETQLLDKPKIMEQLCSCESKLMIKLIKSIACTVPVPMPLCC